MKTWQLSGLARMLILPSAGAATEATAGGAHRRPSRSARRKYVGRDERQRLAAGGQRDTSRRRLAAAEHLPAPDDVERIGRADRDASLRARRLEREPHLARGRRPAAIRTSCGRVPVEADGDRGARARDRGSRVDRRRRLDRLAVHRDATLPPDRVDHRERDARAGTGSASASRSSAPSRGRRSTRDASRWSGLRRTSVTVPGPAGTRGRRRSRRRCRGRPGRRARPAAASARARGRRRPASGRAQEQRARDHRQQEGGRRRRTRASGGEDGRRRRGAAASTAAGAGTVGWSTRLRRAPRRRGLVGDVELGEVVGLRLARLAGGAPSRGWRCAGRAAPRASAGGVGRHLAQPLHGARRPGPP